MLSWGRQARRPWRVGGDRICAPVPTARGAPRRRLAQLPRRTRRESTRLRVAARSPAAWDCADQRKSAPRSVRALTRSPRGSQVRGSEGDLPLLGPSLSAGAAKRKRPPNLDLAAICSWLPRSAPEHEPPQGPRLREGSPRRNSCPLQAVAASPAAPSEWLFKRARRPGLPVRVLPGARC